MQLTAQMLFSQVIQHSHSFISRQQALQKTEHVRQSGYDDILLRFTNLECGLAHGPLIAFWNVLWGRQHGHIESARGNTVRASGSKGKANAYEFSLQGFDAA